MSTEFKQKELIDGYHRLIIENYCAIATTALLWFDFGLTFTTEVRRIWRRRFSGATLIYLFMRYTALIERLFFVLMIVLLDSSDQTCGGITHTDDVLVILNYLSFAAFAILRVYGVWGRDWKPLLFIVPLTLVKPVMYSILSANYIPGEAGPPFGCAYYMTISDLLYAQLSTTAKAATIAADAILIALTWIKTYGIHKESSRLGIRTPLATLVLRDGTAYFIILLFIQVITIVFSQIGSQITVWIVWSYFDQVFTVIFLSRFMLDLRGLYFSDPNGSSGEGTGAPGGHVFSDIRFTSSLVVGNLGAPLSHSSSETDSLDSPSSPTHGPRPNDVEANCSTREGMSDEKEPHGRQEWYEDESPAFVADPFAAGMKAQLAIELTAPTLRVAEVEL